MLPEEAYKIGQSASSLSELIEHPRAKGDGRVRHNHTEVYISGSCAGGHHHQCGKQNCSCECHKRGA
jgi:hypothetical protein